jgi:hypothetical protein
MKISIFYDCIAQKDVVTEFHCEIVFQAGTARMGETRGQHYIIGGGSIQIYALLRGGGESSEKRYIIHG